MGVSVRHVLPFTIDKLLRQLTSVCHVAHFGHMNTLPPEQHLQLLARQLRDVFIQIIPEEIEDREGGVTLRGEVNQLFLSFSFSSI
jgi:hypothetical protein